MPDGHGARVALGVTECERERLELSHTFAECVTQPGRERLEFGQSERERVRDADAVVELDGARCRRRSRLTLGRRLALGDPNALADADSERQCARVGYELLNGDANTVLLGIALYDGVCCERDSDGDGAAERARDGDGVGLRRGDINHRRHGLGVPDADRFGIGQRRRNADAERVALP